MMRSATLSSLALVAFALFISQSDAKFYKDFIKIDSGVPGNELLFHSSHAVQKLDFFASVQIDIRYPQNSPHSNYILSHILITGQDDTGNLEARFYDGGPGKDYMKLNIGFNYIKNGDFEVFLYGKKK